MENDTLISPTALLIYPHTGNIYISEHDGHVVSVFNPVFKTFSDFPPMAEDALPFGMALDKDRNLWVAEHVTNRIAVIDPSSSQSKEVTIPSSSPFVQYLTTDNEGKVLFAAQRVNALGFITSNVNMLQSASSSPSSSSFSSPVESKGKGQVIDVGYEYLLSTFIAIGVVASAAFYVNSIVKLKTSIRQVNGMSTTVDSNTIG